MISQFRRVALGAGIGLATTALLTFAACSPDAPVDAVSPTPTLRAAHLPADLEGGTDHFTCYEAIEDNAGTSVTISLTDQWQTLTNVGVSNILEFCNPTEKTTFNAAGASHVTTITEEDAHLAFYELTQKLPSIRKRVTITNQFNNGAEQVLRVAAPKLVAVPTVKNNVGNLDDVEEALSHFTCYEASGKRILENVTLDDQFDGSVEGLVHGPHYFCLPAAKTLGTVTPIAADEDHLA